ncbi:MAG: UDP-glucose 4-epimerase GalE [Mycoplasmoidaceae bacterium]
MKVLVTGGAGYIGSHAVYKLIENGYDVIVVDNLSTGYLENIHEKAKFYNGDIKNAEFLNTVFKIEKNISSILHFAGSIIVSESIENPSLYFENNVCATNILLSISKKFNIKNFIFSSTAAVYGEIDNVPINESNNTHPINPYGQSKLACEFLIKSWAEINDVNYIIFRYFNVCGAHKNLKLGIKVKKLTHLIPSIAQVALLNNKPFEIFGDTYNTKDGTCIRDFIHVEDLIDAHIKGLEWLKENKKSSIFNLGSGFGYSVKEIYDSAVKELKINIDLIISPKRIGDPAKLYASTKLSENVLKWKPKLNLSDMIRSEYNFRKKLLGK